jgi:tRNA pseudouridine55 synthase
MGTGESVRGNHAGSSGLLLVNKESGRTSFETLGAVKRAFYPAKVGHTGTLDKFAEGLLLVLVGRAVKLAPWFSSCDKHYRGTIRFGVETDTLDNEGTPVAEAAPPSHETLLEVLPRFRGDILQTPPAYSAVHVDGERAHIRARSGEEFKMEERPVSIYGLELEFYDPPLAGIRVHCSKGTYIRSLARDIARAAGSRGYLSALKRTQVAGFSLDGAVNAETPGLPGFLKPIDGGIFDSLGIPRIRVDITTARKFSQGKALYPLIDSLAPPLQEVFAALYPLPEGGEELAGIIEKKAGRWQYGYVYGHP